MTDEVRLKVFWAVENNNLQELETICRELCNEKNDIGMYFPQKMWETVFSKEEGEKIKVYLCGSVDFSPLQHAFALDWLNGCKCLIKYNIGCRIQGQGLKVIDSEWQNAIKNI